MTGSVYGLPNTKFGTFSQSTMDESGKKGWVVISMKDGWKRTFRSISRRGGRSATNSRPINRVSLV